MSVPAHQVRLRTLTDFTHAIAASSGRPAALTSIARQVATTAHASTRIAATAALLREPALSSMALLVLARAASPITPMDVLAAFARHPGAVTIRTDLARHLAGRHQRPELVEAMFATAATAA